MIKKIISMADVHISNEQKSEILQDLFGRLFERYREIVSESNPGEVAIVIAGDVYENHVSTNNEGSVKAAWFLRELNSIAPTYIIGGNHDCDSSNLERLDTISTYMMIARPDNTIYLDETLDYASGCYVDNGIIWAVYSQFSGFARPDIEGAKKENPGLPVVGLVHADINGSVMCNGYKTEIGLEKTIFKGCDFVIAGHIHKHQEIKQGKVKIVYCGSTIQQNFGESISGHGFVVWDVENKTYEFEELPNPDYSMIEVSVTGVDDILNDTEKLLNA